MIMRIRRHCTSPYNKVHCQDTMQTSQQVTTLGDIKILICLLLQVTRNDHISNKSSDGTTFWLAVASNMPYWAASIPTTACSGPVIMTLAFCLHTDHPISAGRSSKGTIHMLYNNLSCYITWVKSTKMVDILLLYSIWINIVIYHLGYIATDLTYYLIYYIPAWLYNNVKWFVI